MGFINVFVGSQCYFKIKNKQLVLTKENNDSISYPIEDLNSIIIENEQSNISVKTLTELANKNVIVYLCDEKHLPSCYLLGYNSFYKNLMVYKYQVDLSKPITKQLWKDIIKHKILNQIKVLELCNIENDLDKYIADIKSDDADNIESVVANKYFKLLFGKEFVRRRTNLINSALNYGYAIIRGAIARTVVAHGLQPFLGIHHKNQLNNFNLVDDLIEVYRPVVDLFVVNNFQNQESDELTPQMKVLLHSLLASDVKIQNGVYDVSTSIDIFVASYVSSIESQKNKIKFPEILEFKVHEYE